MIVGFGVNFFQQNTDFSDLLAPKSRFWVNQHRHQYLADQLAAFFPHNSRNIRNYEYKGKGRGSQIRKTYFPSSSPPEI